MGSEFEIAVACEDAARTERAAYDALDRVDWLEQQLSHFQPDSEISRVNALACEQPVPVSESLWNLLVRMREWSAETEGAVDPTAGKMVREWGFFRRGQVHGESVLPPDPGRLATLAANIGWRNVEMDAEMHTVRFLTPDVELHLGAVGKGYIVQCAADFLRSEGVECALLQSGQSSIATIGRTPDNDEWRIGVEDPRPDGQVLAVAQLSNNALSSSGISEQFVTVGERRIGHLFDPRTGLPVERYRAVWVCSPDAAQGDALSTAFCVQGEEWAADYCAAHPEIAALFLPMAGAEIDPDPSGLVAVGNTRVFTR